jgi:ParB-like chromosome segregation protein Spo0J
MIKLTPEQNAYRLQRLREAMNKPRSKLWLKHQSEGIRKAIAEGRWKRVITSEAIEKTAAKLRGRKRPPEVVEKIRLALIGKKRSPEYCRAMSELVRKEYAEGKRSRMSLEHKQKLREAAKLANTGRKPSAEQSRKHSEAMKGRKWKQEIIEKRAAPMRNRPQVALLTKKGPTNKKSISGILRSPENILYEFKNLTHFVREHSYLFLEQDVIWKRSGTTIRCNASHGLLDLFGRSKNVRGSWKGWTVYSHVEHTYNNGDDLLKRPWDIDSRISQLKAGVL